MTEPELHHFSADGGFPNSRLPVLVYRSALPPDAAAMESMFAANSWSNSWRNGIFRYHHFHSIAHEVLGLAAGEVTVAFGGPSGRQVAVRAGDVVVIPAGMAHRNMGQSGDLLGEVMRAIAAVPLPGSDPVHGARVGPQRFWLA